MTQETPSVEHYRCSPGAGDKGGVGGFRGVLALDPAQGRSSTHVQD